MIAHRATFPQTQSITACDIHTLHPWTQNARSHSKAQIKQIAASITEFGFTTPVLIDQDHRILAGHGRVAAAQMLGWTQVPCLQIAHMSPAQKQAYRLADNQIALNASWDEELRALQELDPAFALDLTGFTIAEIDTPFDLVAPTYCA